MTMQCTKWDMDLLLRSHGELSLLKRLMLAGHLLHCPRCRAREMEFAAVTLALREGLSPQGVAAGHQFMRIRRAPLRTVFVTALLVAILSACYALGVQLVKEFAGTPGPGADGGKAAVSGSAKQDACKTDARQATGRKER